MVSILILIKLSLSLQESNADDKDEMFGGFDLNIAHIELGFDDDKDEILVVWI